MKTQLLCTFVNLDNYKKYISLILKNYKVLYKKIYILQNENYNNELFLTYNVEYNNDIYDIIPKTISIHRKKYTNTLYTINSINEIIKEKNNGILDIDYDIDWNEFNNMLLVTNSDGLRVIETRIFKIIYL